MSSESGAVARLRAQVRSLREQLREAEDARVVVEVARDAYKTQLASVEAEVASQTLTISQLQRELRAGSKTLVAELAREARSLAATSDTVSIKDTQIKMLRSQVAELEALTVSRDEVDTLGEDLSLDASMSDFSISGLTAPDSDAADETLTRPEMRRRMGELRRSLRVVRSRSADISEENVRLTDELVRVQEMWRNAALQNKVLRKQLDLPDQDPDYVDPLEDYGRHAVSHTLIRENKTLRDDLAAAKEHNNVLAAKIRGLERTAQLKEKASAQQMLNLQASRSHFDLEKRNLELQQEVRALRAQVESLTAQAIAAADEDVQAVADAERRVKDRYKAVLAKAKKKLFAYRRKMASLEGVISRLRQELTQFKTTVKRLRAYIQST